MKRAGGDARRTERLAARVRQRGSVAVLFALCLVFILIGLLALVIDVGHFWEVRAELQNGADSAALAGVRDLDGTSLKFGVAVQSSHDYALRHRANGADIDVPASDVVLGNWNFQTRTFLPMQTPAPQVNAVQVTTRRTAATGDPVATFFASVLGVTQQDITATAIAVGGSPKSTCGFPVVVEDCSLYDDAGNLACDAVLKFNTADDNVGTTLFAQKAPISTPDLECAMATALGLSPAPPGAPKVPGKCADSTCNATSTETGSIYIGNGNNLLDAKGALAVDMIRWALNHASPPGSLLVQMPVIASGQTTRCSKFTFTGNQPIAGYVEMRITDATKGPPAEITARVDCTQSGAAPPGGGFYGYKSTYVYIAQ